MKKETPSFERLYAELEAVLEKLESGNLTLDESLEQYERGVKLARQCGELLDRAELRVKELSIDASGEMRLDDLPALE